MNYPSECNSIFDISVINLIVQEVFELIGKDELEVTLTKHLELEIACDVELSAKLKYMIEALQSLASTTMRYELAPIFMPKSHQKILLSIVHASIR